MSQKQAIVDAINLLPEADAPKAFLLPLSVYNKLMTLMKPERMVKRLRRTKTVAI